MFVSVDTSSYAVLSNTDDTCSTETLKVQHNSCNGKQPFPLQNNNRILYPSVYVQLYTWSWTFIKLVKLLHEHMNDISNVLS